MDRFREEIKNILLKLPSDKGHILFAVLICEKLFPNYVAFQKTYGWGNCEILQEGIALIRMYLINENLFDTSEIMEAIERIDKVTPSTEDFSQIVTSFALDASNSIYSTLHYIIDKNIDHIADVASFARDTVDMYIQEVEGLDANDPKIEEKIESNKYMVQEKKFQRELINKIIKIDFDRLTDLMIDELKDNKIKIDLELLP